MRADLYYRLNVFNIHMPPLRDHMEDLPLMAESILAQMNDKHNRRVSGVAQSMIDRMMGYGWPGNVRELRNTIERAVILCPDGAPLDVEHLLRVRKATAGCGTFVQSEHDPRPRRHYGRRGRATAHSEDA